MKGGKKGRDEWKIRYDMIGGTGIGEGIIIMECENEGKR